MSNSNFNITKVTVDPTSQEITGLEVNGKAFESGGGSELEDASFDEYNPLNVEGIFGDKPGPVEIYPSEGYDGLERVVIQPGGITGYPGEGLGFVNNPTVSLSGIPSEISIEIPRGSAWTGIITIYPEEQP